MGACHRAHIDAQRAAAGVWVCGCIAVERGIYIEVSVSVSLSVSVSVSVWCVYT